MEIGRDAVVAIVAALALLCVASLRFTQLQSRAGLLVRAGAGTRLFFSVAAWASWAGSVVAWLLVLAETVSGRPVPRTSLFLALALALVAPPLGRMNALLRPESADARREGEADYGGTPGGRRGRAIATQPSAEGR